MTPQQIFLAECIVNDLVQWLMEDCNKEMADALAVVYNSQTFEKLQDPSTGLYQEGSGYCYELLKDEIQEGKFVQREI